MATAQLRGPNPRPFTHKAIPHNKESKEMEPETVSLWKSDIRAIMSCVLADMESEGIEITPDTVEGVEYGLREAALFEIR